MLLMSAADEAELERKRAQFGGCRLSPGEDRLRRPFTEVLNSLPDAMSHILRTRLKTKDSAKPLCLQADEVADIENVAKQSRQDIMVLFLGVAAAMAESLGENSLGSAVVEGDSGALYIGVPVIWNGEGVKFSAHSLQTAVLNAWHQGEKQIRSLIAEVPPCVCCRQFLRETAVWDNIKILLPAGVDKVSKQTIFEKSPFNMEGIRIGAKARLMGESKRGIALKSQDNPLTGPAAEAASMAYAPYSRNYAGVALKTKNGRIFQGRYAEIRDSLVGVLAVESALINLVLSGESLDTVDEIVLVETRGTATQFSATQTLATAMGNVPFRFMLTG